jgi:ABC-type transport system involved in multi-copper enzyme maturation permease subunit
MIPYIGILIDSFWEAVGNKVLWALLIGWSIILLALAPFGYISERSFQLSSADIESRTALVEKLAKAAKGQGGKSIQAVVRKLDDDFLARISENQGENDRNDQIKSSELAQELNVAVNARGLYSEESFPTAKRRKRLEPLIETPADELTSVDLEELNRELLQLAFPLELNGPRGEQLWIGYAGFKIGEPLPVSRRQISQFLEPLFLGIVIKLGLGILAVFVAIIVTSPIIPDTFRSGSLHLLLSKPISRIWLYLSKFFGGCTFVLMNISFVLLGLYLIAGFRFAIWNEGLLACIPLLLFVFVIFYSVSGLAGLIWGNAIVSVVACLIFWFACFSAGFIHDLMMPQVDLMPRISRIRPIEGYLTVVNEKGDFNVWNEEFAVWQPGIKSENGGQSRTFGPIYDEGRRQIILKSFFRVPFGNPFARSRKLSLISLDNVNSSDQVQVETDSPSQNMPAGTDEPNQGEQAGANSKSGEQIEAAEIRVAGKNSTNGASSASQAREMPLWMSDPGPDLPAQVFELLSVGDTILVVCRGGIFRLDLQKLELIEASEKALMGLKIPWLSKSAFENIAPKDYYLSDNSYAAVTAAADGLIVYSSGNLDHLKLRPKGLELISNTKLDGDGTEAAIAQMNADYCVVARDGLPLEVLDSNLRSVAKVELGDEAKVKQMAWVPESNSLAIITHTGELLKLDCETSQIVDFDLPLNDNITCMTWLDASRAYVGVQPNRVYLVDLQLGTVIEKFVPHSSMLELIYRFAIDPIYTIMPKPAALDNAMTYLLSGSETQTMNIVTNDLEAAQLELDIWTPVVSNLAFVVFALGVSCLYVNRKEY